MIISASRRTDIPAFYSDWFLNRISQGYLLLKNPFNANQIRRVSLLPQDVELIVFWTRNAEKLIPKLKELDSRGFRYYFQYTINAYVRSIDKSTPNAWRAIDTFIELSKLIGKEKVIWRYDPILVSNLSSIDEHKRVFEKLAKNLSGYTERVIVSFVDIYKKVSANIRKAKNISIVQDFTKSEHIYDLAVFLSEIANKYGLKIQTCAEEINLQQQGIIHGKCIDDLLIHNLFSIDLPNKKDKRQRSSCGCIESVDIGQYNTCLHGCLYCYATTNQSLAQRNFEIHNPLSPFLIGGDSEIQTNKLIEHSKNQDSLF